MFSKIATNMTAAKTQLPKYHKKAMASYALFGSEAHIPGTYLAMLEARLLQ